VQRATAAAANAAAHGALRRVQTALTDTGHHVRTFRWSHDGGTEQDTWAAYRTWMTTHRDAVRVLVVWGHGHRDGRVEAFGEWRSAAAMLPGYEAGSLDVVVLGVCHGLRSDFARYARTVVGYAGNTIAPRSGLLRFAARAATAIRAAKGGGNSARRQRGGAGGGVGAGLVPGTGAGPGLRGASTLSSGRFDRRA
jgi:hypothetical protein